MPDDAYILRPRDREEVERLAFQHRVWKVETDAVVDRAGFAAGDRLLDLGCGPGFLALDLARKAGSGGRVLGVDSSEAFVAHLRAEARRLELDRVGAEVADVREIAFDEESFDGAICRWVLMFVPKPERAVRSVAAALRPGGVFAVMEYTHFRNISLFPDGRAFRTIYDAVHRRIADVGGDADIGARLPSMLVESGFEIVDLLPFWRVGRPGSDLWRWLEGTHANHAGMVEVGLLGRRDIDAYLREWDEHASHPAAYFTAPPLLATIARKT